MNSSQTTQKANHIYLVVMSQDGKPISQASYSDLMRNLSAARLVPLYLGKEYGVPRETFVVGSPNSQTRQNFESALDSVLLSVIEQNPGLKVARAQFGNYPLSFKSTEEMEERIVKANADLGAH